MADQENRTEATGIIISGQTTHLIGVVVFLGGVIMLIMVFVWTYTLLAGVDYQTSQISSAAPVANPAAQAEAQGTEASPFAPTVAVPSSGPTLLQVAAKVGLKLIVLAVMAWAGALVASKGVQMAHGER